MKKSAVKLILGCFLLAIAAVVYSAPPVAEAPIKTVGTPVTVAISSTTLTKIPTSQMSGRAGIFVSNPPQNTQAISGFFGDCTSTSLAATILPIEIVPSTGTLVTNNRYFPIREDVCLWLISRNIAAATANIHYQEVGQ